MWVTATLPSHEVPVTTRARVSVTNRVIAKLIDIALVMALGALPIYPAGPLLGFLYSLIADGMNFGPFHGQSLGKRLFRLRVIQSRTGRSAKLRDSIYRNAPVGVATFFAIIPVWGWLILALIGLPLMVLEIYLMATVNKGQRLGDVMGDTEVIDGRGDGPLEPRPRQRTPLKSVGRQADTGNEPRFFLPLAHASQEARAEALTHG